MKKLLILGGFPQMIDVVMIAKSMGIYTIVTDRDPASPAKRFADKSVNISTDRLEDLEAICQTERVDGVFTGFEDFNIHIARKLCHRLGLPFYATEEQLAIVTNKHRFKEECRRYGIPVIEQASLETALAEGKYPYIVKPTDSYGSRGITVCRDAEALKRGCEKAVAVSASGTAIIERFIESDHGTELFYTIVDGHIHLTATADRYTAINGESTVPLPVAEVFPSRHADEMKRTMDQNIRQMLKGMGLENGLVLIQALYDRGEFFVYEMAYRLTGEQHYRLVARQEGINLAQFMLRLALGEDVSQFDTPLLDDDHFRHPAINYAILLNPGTIQSIRGLEQVYKIEEVISYNLTHADHDVIRASGDYSHMLIRINMVAENYGQLRSAVEQVNAFISVTSDEGEDMLTTRFSLPDMEVM